MSGLDVRWRRVEAQAGVRLADPDCRILAEDFLELSQHLASEVSRPCVVGADLILQTLPRDECRLLKIAHPVGEPDVEVDGEG